MVQQTISARGVSPLGKLIFRSRRQMHINQATLAYRAGVPLSLVSQLEQGRATYVSYAQLINLALALEESLADLLGALPYELHDLRNQGGRYMPLYSREE